MINFALQRSRISLKIGEMSATKNVFFNLIILFLIYTHMTISAITVAGFGARAAFFFLPEQPLDSKTRTLFEMKKLN